MQRHFSLLMLLFVFISVAQAQNRDIEPIDTYQLQLKLKKNILPSRLPVLYVMYAYIPYSPYNVKVNYWKTKTAVGLNLNQAAFSDNWSGGGVNSLALGGTINYKAEYNKNDINYISELLMIYGKVKNKGQLERKSNDRIFLDNRLALKMSKNWSFFGSISFESQFDNGYTYGKDGDGNETQTIMSKFMSPGYLTESIGFEYKPSKAFSTRIGTGTARQTFVLDTALYRTNPKNFGVTPGHSFHNELAFQIVSALDKDIAPNMNLKSRYAMFIPYDTPQKIDHRLDAVLTAKINRVFNVNLSGVLLFDNNTDGKLQASQSLSLGVLFAFPR